MYAVVLAQCSNQVLSPRPLSPRQPLRLRRGRQFYTENKSLFPMCHTFFIYLAFGRDVTNMVWHVHCCNARAMTPELGHSETIAPSQLSSLFSERCCYCKMSKSYRRVCPSISCPIIVQEQHSLVEQSPLVQPSKITSWTLQL